MSRSGFSPTGANSQTRGWMNSVESRLEVMETQQRLFSSSVKGGAIVVYNDQLKQVGRIGVGKYGSGGEIREAPVFAFSTPDNKFHVLIDLEDGWVTPTWRYNFVQDSFVAVTSASDLSIWKSQFTTHGLALVMQFLVGADASTTGTVKIQLNQATDSDEVSIPAGQFTVVRYIWDLSDITAINAISTVRVLARRDTGTGNINVYSPDAVFTASLRAFPAATPGGIPDLG